MESSVTQITWAVAFMAGVISFISPCILPLVPGYLSLITKLNYDQLATNKKEEKYIGRILFQSIVFVLGFSFVFVLLGASASYMGSFLKENRILFLQISGVAVILFGLITLELVHFPAMYKEKKIHFNNAKFGTIGTFLLGAAFGFGWTPCVGPVLATILFFASTSESLTSGALLLSIYSLGLGLPFIISGLVITKALRAFTFIKRNYVLYKYVVGITLIIVGTLMLTNNLYFINIYGQKIFDYIGINYWNNF